DRQGTAQGSDFIVPSDVFGYEGVEDLSVAPGGALVVAWTALSFDLDVRARRFSAQGVPQGPDLRISETAKGFQVEPSIGMAPDGSFVAMYQGYNASTDVGAFARRFDAGGNPLGPASRVDTQGVSAYPMTAFDASGRFVVAWMSNPAGQSSYHVRARRFDADGTPLGP